MDPRFAPLAACAAASHGVLSRHQARAAGLSDSTVHRWVRSGLFERLGPRSLAIGGSPATWHRALAAALVEVGPHAALAGRSAARLLGLDGFDTPAVEVVLGREHRRTRVPPGIDLHVTARRIERRDVLRVDGLPCLRAERLILEAPLFGFGRDELENAIDSAVRLRLVSEHRLRAEAVTRHSPGINGGRALLDALVDSGVESHLERRFLALVGRSGLARPRRQVVHRDGARHLARVDFLFGEDLVVEVAGHGGHATRRQRQVDAQRQTDLTISGRRILTFTYDDVIGRPSWVVDRLARAGVRAA